MSVPSSAARVSRCWTLRTSAGTVDVQVVARDTDLLGVVAPEVAGAVGADGASVWAGTTQLPPDLPLSAPHLAHGALLGWGGAGPRSASDAVNSALELRVTGGPDAGLAVPLEQGTHVLGRAPRPASASATPTCHAGTPSSRWPTAS